LIIADILRNAAERFGDRLCVSCEGETLTYGQLGQVAHAYAAYFQQAGLHAGECAILVAQNGPQFLAAYFGLHLAGIIPAPVGPSWKAAEIHTAATLVGTHTVVVDEHSQSLAQTNTPDLNFLVLPRNTHGMNHSAVAQASENELAHVRFTSGTTATPKAVALSHQNLTWRLDNEGSHCGSDDRFLCCVAFPYRIMKLLMALHVGAEIHAIRSFRLQSLCDALQTAAPTWLWVTPAVCGILEQKIDRPAIFASVRGMASAGAYLPIAVQERFQNKFNINIYQHYGLSEAMDVTEMPAGLTPVLGSVGRACQGITVTTAAATAADTDAEIVVQGPNVMMGYIDTDTDGRRQITPVPCRQLHTGDLGYLDANGFLFLTGREKAFINVDGRKVAPQEIEAVICSCPGVCTAAVAAEPDELRGEVPVAWVVTNADNHWQQACLQRYCLERLANYKVPRKFYFVDQLPHLDSGKFKAMAKL
jgi:long-chain acyl-CoA synthetase